MSSRSSCKIVQYSPKCVVLVGNTTEYKEDMKTMGGKWNSRLTNKETGEKFGGWIFMKSREDALKSWIDSGKVSKFEFDNNSRKDKELKIEDDVLKLLLKRIDVLESEVKMLKERLDDSEEYTVEDDSGEEEEVTPRRLLR